jgi:glutamate N-acetyltransferase/amino-acid N-acetyltransferase
MSVGKDLPVKCQVISGVTLTAVEAGIRYANRRDLVLIELAAGTVVSGVFTRNAFCAAPVQVAREHLLEHAPRYLLINTGNANAGTGTQGLHDARSSCQAVAELAGVDAGQVLPFSTGVIGEPLSMEKLIAGLPSALDSLRDHAWEQAARGIMTTDTRPKSATCTLYLADGEVRISAIAKGAGMIKPNMATMLAFVFTDAAVARPLLDDLLVAAVDKSFNRITVDGDTSTNDCCVLAATGRSGVTLSTSDELSLQQFRAALEQLFRDLAVQLIKDAEGASKFITIEIGGGASTDECLKVGYCVAESPLVKTAFFASDPNWGRILAAIGRAGLDDLDIERVTIFLGETPLVANGGRADSYTEAQGQLEMDKEEITVRIDLARGDCAETLWTSDLSCEYVRINADYRS